MFFTSNLKIEVAGDSHGPAIVSFIEGMPYGLHVDEDYINRMLEKRQNCLGRGSRMKLENDKVEILGGTWEKKTTGMPLILSVKNRGTYPESDNPRNIPRPGHCDYAAYLKFKDTDMRKYAEGASARRTAGTVAVGSFLKNLLESKGVIVEAFVESVGNIKTNVFENCFTKKIDMKKMKSEKEKNDLYMPDQESYVKARDLIDRMRESGDTLGGRIKIIISGVQGGLGNFSTPDKRLDALITANLMAIPSVKGVFIGNESVDEMIGSYAHDEFDVENGKICRKSNNAGGIEAGTSNGEDIIITTHFKPIPSLRKQLESVDVVKKTKIKTEYVRSDVTAIAPAVIVSECVAAISIFDALLERGVF